MNIDEINVAIGELVELGLIRHARDENGELMMRDGRAVWEAVPPEEIEGGER